MTKMFDASVGWDVGGCIELWRLNLYDIYRKPLLLLSGTVFSGRMRFLSVQKRRLARASAQWPLPARDGIYGTVNSRINPL
ncbi:MAG: hypothetical protein EPO19_03545 [Betaproteobacteria bacterium]|nr:MAG: hypothetical protein EPO19_03545 [Betaproteobacteria bacterium]